MKSNVVKFRNEYTGIELAVLKAGCQKHLASVMGVSQQSVSKWVSQGFVPMDRAEQIHELYGIPKRVLVDPKLIEFFAV